MARNAYSVATIAMLWSIAALSVSDAHASWSFTDVTSQAGINYVHTAEPVPPLGQPIPTGPSVCGGVAAGDYDNDGWTDLYAIRGSGGANLLYRNRGDGTFEDHAEAAGVAIVTQGCGATFADYDGDGWLDLLVTGYDQATQHLFRNRGDGTFEDESSALPLERESYSATFADYDRDGDLDVFLGHWEEEIPAVADEHLWRNEGNGTFTDVGVAAGIDVSNQAGRDFSFTPNVVDMDDDGWPDLLFAVDFEQSRVFRNDGDGTFTDQTDRSVITDQNGMGAALCDYDADGDLDWFVTAIYFPGIYSGNRMYRNDSGPEGIVFTDTTDAAGVREGDWGWAATCQDFDNDGTPDIFHVNGWPSAPFSNPPARLYRGTGDGSFVEEASLRNVADTGNGVGVVAFDYDHDGDLDLFITNNRGAPKLYRNDGGTNHFLSIKLDGQAPNTQAIGARVLVTAGGTTQTQEIRAGSNYISQDPALAHFGLGTATTVDQVEIRWPLGGSTVLTQVAPNQRLTISEPPNTCGDGTIDPGEQCDRGSLNGSESCCSVNCRLRPTSTTCRGPLNLCDAPETCDGLSAECPADAVLPADTVCRKIDGPCDIEERCSGASKACPEDQFAPASHLCRPEAGDCDRPDFCDGTQAQCPNDSVAPQTEICREKQGPCDLQESCTGTDAQCPADAKSTAQCRDALTSCDEIEFCDGIQNDCPDDAVAAEGKPCRPSIAKCDQAEVCDGIAAVCPADEKSTDVCRPALAACDLPEVCDGQSDHCPADTFHPVGTQCRAPDGFCDVPENCSGASPFCPPNGFQAEGVVCREPGGACGLPEACTGDAPACPADAHKDSSVVCRDPGGVCGLAESCSGDSALCPEDQHQDAAFVCRKATLECDETETCSGTSAACPADGFAPEGQTCRPPQGGCDAVETCTGTTAACPADTKSTGLCRPENALCDEAEFCDGVSDDCPADAPRIQGAICRDTEGACDTVEVCDGTSFACPSDQVATGKVCRPPEGACDQAETCDGVAKECPPDFLHPLGSVCRDSKNACDLVEKCDGVSISCPDDTGLPDGDDDGACDALDLCPTQPDPAQLDGDGDGLGDVCDPCTTTQASSMSSTLVKLIGLVRPAGEHKLKLKGFVDLPGPLNPPLDPLSHPLRLVVSSASNPREPFLDVTLPTAAYDRATREGWIVNSSRTTFKYKSEGDPEGINRVTLQGNKNDSGRIKVVLSGKNGTYPADPLDLPLTLTLALNDSGGQCGDYTFDDGCKTNRKLDKILCR